MRHANFIFCAIILSFGLVIPITEKVSATEIAIVSFTGSGEVGFISIKNAKVLKRINLLGANEPGSIAITPDGKKAVVACFAGNICFLDIEKLECVKNLELFRGPEQYGVTLLPNEFNDVVITPNGNQALVTEKNEIGQVFSIDIETMALSGLPFSVGDEPEKIIISANGLYAYLLDEGSIHKVNLSKKTYVTFSQPAGTDEIGDFDITPNELQAIFIDGDNWITLTDTTTWDVIDKKKVDTTRFTEPGQVALSPDGSVAIVANSSDPSITFVGISESALTILDTIEVGGSAGLVAFTQNSQTAVVTVINPNLVQIIDVPNRQIKATVSEKLGLKPLGVAIVEVGEEPAENFPVVGDINNDNKIDLIESIHALQITAGLSD